MGKRFRSHVRANVVGYVALFFALSGTAVAVTQLDRNSVRSKHIVNSQVRGADVNERTLARVPRALRAERLGGLPAVQYLTRAEVVPFHLRLSFGQKVEFLSNGPIGVEADCRENIVGDQDEIRLLAVTRAEGSFMTGDTPHRGPGSANPPGTYLTPATEPDLRTLGGGVTQSSAPNEPLATDDVDGAFVAGPNGEYIGIDTETAMQGLHVGQSDCIVAGSAVIKRATP